MDYLPKYKQVPFWSPTQHVPAQVSQVSPNPPPMSQPRVPKCPLNPPHVPGWCPQVYPNSSQVSPSVFLKVCIPWSRFPKPTPCPRPIVSKCPLNPPQVFPRVPKCPLNPPQVSPSLPKSPQVSPKPTPSVPKC